MKRVFEELDIPVEWQEEFESWDVDFEADTGSSGDMVYGYYFVVPECAEPDFLNEMSWAVGQTVRLSVNAFDSADEHDE